MSAPHQDGHVPHHPALQFKAFIPASATATPPLSDPALNDGPRLPRSQTDIITGVHRRNWAIYPPVSPGSVPDAAPEQGAGASSSNSSPAAPAAEDEARHA